LGVSRVLGNRRTASQGNSQLEALGERHFTRMKTSVAMCTYNGAPYLLDQLESIATQTRLPAELVICDDLSTDTTCEIINRFAATAPFPVQLHINERNLGSTKNFERAIRLCEGDAIALCDQDDVWLPTKLQRIEECFDREPDVGLVFTDASVVDERLQPLGYRLWESVGFDESHRELVHKGRVLDVLLPGWTVTGATMAFRTTFRKLIEDIPIDLPLIHDGWIALMIASVSRVIFIGEPLIQYRQHPRQQIGAKQKEKERTQDSVRTGIRRANSYDEMIATATRALARLAEHNADFETAHASAQMEDRLKHLRTRAGLSNLMVRRIRSVAGELLSQRYHRYSNGFRSAVKDLLS